MKKCKYCGVTQGDTVEKCVSCGAAEFLNVCDYCGTLFESSCCPSCGLQAGENAYHCPNCGRKMISVYCPDCGTPRAAGRAQHEAANIEMRHPAAQSIPVKRTNSNAGPFLLLVFFPLIGVWAMAFSKKISKAWKIFTAVYSVIIGILYFAMAFTGEEDTPMSTLMVCSAAMLVGAVATVIKLIADGKKEKAGA